MDTLASLLAGELTGAELVALDLPVSGILGGGRRGKVGVLADLGVGSLVDLLKSIG